MPILDGYSDVLVVQRILMSGCIPAGIEWMLRYLKIPNINFEGFQERHDLGNCNSFWSVAKHVMSEIAGIKIIDRQFSYGKEKIEYIGQLIKESRPCLMSIALLSSGRWHIVPVVEVNGTFITVLWMDKPTIEEQKKKFTLVDIEQRHDSWKGGKDILFTEV